MTDRTAARHVARLTAHSGSNFYYAFRLLPAPKRRAIYALYAFCRLVDDCVDEPDGEGAAGLERWLREVRAAYAGRPETPLGQELAEAVRAFPIPFALFEEITDGCRMDLSITRYATADELAVYCRRVASAVGLATIEVFGYTQPAAREYAVQLGLALQLTNILRDLAGDARRGRLYLPLEHLRRFGVDERLLLAAALGAGPRPSGTDALLAFEAARARAHFAAAAAALPDQDRRALRPAEAMGAVYRAILGALEQQRFPLDGRVRLARARRVFIALRVMLGWASS